HLDSTVISIVGSPSRVNEAMSEVRAADAKIPPGEKLPVEIVTGTLTWKDVLGAGTSLKFDAMHVTWDPRVDQADATLQTGTLDLSSMTLAPLDVHAKTQKSSVHVTGSLAKDAATIDVTRNADG